MKWRKNMNLTFEKIEPSKLKVEDLIPEKGQNLEYSRFYVSDVVDYLKENTEFSNVTLVEGPSSISNRTGESKQSWLFSITEPRLEVKEPPIPKVNRRRRKTNKLLTKTSFTAIIL